MEESRKDLGEPRVFRQEGETGDKAKRHDPEICPPQGKARNVDPGQGRESVASHHEREVEHQEHDYYL